MNFLTFLLPKQNCWLTAPWPPVQPDPYSYWKAVVPVSALASLFSLAKSFSTQASSEPLDGANVCLVRSLAIRKHLRFLAYSCRLVSPPKCLWTTPPTSTHTTITCLPSPRSEEDPVFLTGQLLSACGVTLVLLPTSPIPKETSKIWRKFQQ